MSGVYLDAIRMKRESKSFTDSLYAILTAAGLFEGPKYMLSGLTGMAFKFTVHERLLPLSVSAYGQHGTEHGPAVDNLGLYTVSDGGRTRHPTFRTYQQAAIRRVRQSLDRGVGVVYWIPEFGVICGYDDEDGVFYIKDGRSDDDMIVLYDNFGLNRTPFWYVQELGGKVEVPLEAMVLESIRLAAADWDTPYKTLPNTDIASGRLAYSFLIRGLESGDYDQNGAAYILDSHLYSREEIRNYLHDVRTLWPELHEAYLLYDQLAQMLAGADRSHLRPFMDVLAAAEKLEDQAVSHFRALSARFPDPKRSIVPRWGAHSPR